MSRYQAYEGVLAHEGNVPKHIVIIMDGNGRWAKARQCGRGIGHRHGVGAVRHVITYCAKQKISALTLFAFGKENWKRPTKEVRNLQRLFFLSLKRNAKELHKQGIRFRVIGDTEPFAAYLKLAIQETEHLTQNNTGLQLNVALNYSGRWDLLQAMQNLGRKIQSGALSPDEMTESDLEAHLALRDGPEPDLFIRTGGVSRISNFMLWELAYTELYFCDVLWPDFTEADLQTALDDFSTRERRFGLTSQQILSQPLNEQAPVI